MLPRTSALVAVLLILGCRTAIAQPVHVLTRDTLEAAGGALWLSGGWRFHPGDGPAFAAPGFDASGWAAAPSLLRVGSPLVRDWPGIGWFQTRLRVDSTLHGERWRLLLMPYGAAEVYLDGELVHRVGRVSADPEEEVRVHTHESSVLPLDEAGEHVIAVRFSNTRADDYLDLWRFIGFELRLGSASKLLQEAQQARQRGLFGMFFLGLYAAFALVHLMLYLAYRASRENLYFSLMIAAIAGIVFLDFGLLQLARSADAILLLPRLFPTCVVVASLAGMAFAYTVFYDRLLRVFYLALGIGALLTLWAWISGMRAYHPFIALFSLLILAENARVVLVALHERKPGAKLIGLGLAAITVGFAVPLLSGLGLFPYDRFQLFPYLMSTVLLVCLSVYLSRNVARTNRDLRRRLVQVEQLSREKLEQEQHAREEELQRKLLEVEYRQKMQELEEARQLQLAMLPSAVPAHPELDIAAYMETAAEVGGDYYDFDVAADGALTLAVGDATGHGMRAGVMVTATKSLFNALSGEGDLLQVMGTSTRALKRMNLRRLYMALVLARYRGGRLRLVTAGMPPVLVYRKATGCIETLRLKGMPLGSFPEFPYREAQVELHLEDAVLFMSDGFPELFNAEREMLGYDRAVDVFAEVAEASPQAIIEHLVAAARQWSGGAAVRDDMTFVVLKKTGVPS